ncbi:HNH endonuclease [Flavobacterium sp. LC2016-01]|uniref:HNH endonuclease n=1 Tax=Flavobacterium sp. LC2016-01 TaxID=2675876 RepID=UPI0012BA78BC|nr:HNH endonuclease [Flavobacterium sp. LC2016-01]MTH15906.1 hypothetical protein [Flavobacterium sp. LC2016-01]
MKCYLTGIEITDENKSLEHILPNALGGQLKSRNILSSKANSDLSVLIDTPFNKIFESIYRRLPLEKDRKSSRGIVGMHQKFNEEIVFKDNKCFPRKPVFDHEKNAVYAQSEKIGKGYIEYLKKKGEIKTEQEIKIWTDLSGEVSFDFEIVNKIFPFGFAKIAAGFATFKGVDRNNLKCILDLDNERFRNDIMILPFYPFTPQEVIFENRSHKSMHYPLHTIVLKSLKQDGILYCYIELFSTFQYIVILDDNYHGDEIYHEYIYDLLNSEEITFETYLNSVIDENVLKKMFLNYKDFSLEELNKIAQHVTAQEGSLRHYCYYKFHQLESFVTYLSITTKLDLLDRLLSK